MMWPLVSLREEKQRRRNHKNQESAAIERQTARKTQPSRCKPETAEKEPDRTRQGKVTARDAEPSR